MVINCTLEHRQYWIVESKAIWIVVDSELNGYHNGLAHGDLVGEDLRYNI